MTAYLPDCISKVLHCRENTDHPKLVLSKITSFIMQNQCGIKNSLV